MKIINFNLCVFFLDFNFYQIFIVSFSKFLNIIDIIIQKKILIRSEKVSNKARFYALFNFFQMSFVPGQELKKEKHVCHLENSIPDDKLLPEVGPIHLPTSERVLKRFYASEGKCALWLFPFHCIQFNDSLKGNAILDDQLNDSPDLSSGRGMKNQPRYR